MEAFAKIAALPHDVSLSTEFTDFSATPTPMVKRKITADAVMDQIEECDSKGVPACCVELTFDVEGTEKTIELYKRPLGAEFSKKSSGPTKVTKVYPQSYAWGAGLEVGWVLKAIDGEDVARKKFAEVQSSLQKTLEKLPLRPRD